jgi:excinuclease UvrABC nuclease subunit
MLNRDDLRALRIDAVSLTAGRSIYFLWLDDFIVYVGQTNRVAARIGQHISENTKKFDAVSVIPVNSDADIDALERAYIKAFAPRYNVTALKEIDRLRQYCEELETEISLLKHANAENPDVLAVAQRDFPAIYSAREAIKSEHTMNIHDSINHYEAM